MRRSLPWLAIAMVILFAGSLPAAQESHTKASLVTPVTSIQPGQPLEVGLRLVMEKGWHTYWLNPGDSGLATTIKWTLPPGFTAGPIQWPTPHRISTPPLMSYGYEGEVLLVTTIQVPGDLKPGTKVELQAAVDWLECLDICLPGAATLKLVLPVKVENPQPVSAEMTKLFSQTRAQWPKTIQGLSVSVAPQSGDGKKLILSVLDSGRKLTKEISSAYFFADDPEWVESAEPQLLLRTKNGESDTEYSLQLTRPVSAQPLKQLSGVLVLDDVSVAISAPVELSAKAASVSAGEGASPTLWLSLLFAFLGGLILNLMPCVLPVLSLKVLSLVKQAGQDPRKAAVHGVAFTVGVLMSFWLLAGILLSLRAAGQELGWGFQMQSPPFIMLLTVLFFVFALNLFGVFEVGTSLTGVDSVAAQRGGVAGSFGMGALATLAATPCTAPFMGAALGFAVAQSAFTAILVFTFLALGMASPYLVLALCPSLLKYVPKPGAWMESFKQFLGFLLLGTVIFLLWVFGQQLDIDAVAQLLGALLVIGLAGWIYGRWGNLSRTPTARGLAILLAAVGLIGGVLWGWRVASAPVGEASSHELVWEPYSAAKLAALRAEGKPVFLDFTAAWCLSCKVNEAVALNNEAVQKKLKESGIVLMKADWTRRDPEITQALASFGRNGVPLYVLYGKDPEAPPQLLPEVLTPGIVLEAVEKLK